MRVLMAALLVLAATSAALAQAWPPLPTTGFITGRAATDKDVTDGNAVFVLKAYGIYFGKPLDDAIPQYGYLTKGGKKVPVIVIQAEIGKGIKLYGVRGLDGDKSVARDYELQLLGVKPPN